MYKKLEKCLKSIREKTDFKPEKAVILGSGLGDYAEKIKIHDQRKSLRGRGAGSF